MTDDERHYHQAVVYRLMDDVAIGYCPECLWLSGVGTFQSAIDLTYEHKMNNRKVLFHE